MSKEVEKSMVKEAISNQNRRRLCRNPCGKALPYRARPLDFEAPPHLVLRQLILSMSTSKGSSSSGRPRQQRALDQR